jgi:hypothetical protein
LAPWNGAISAASQRLIGPRRDCFIRFRMDILKMLGELRHERSQIEEAILVLQRLSLGQGKRRGRPPAWMAAAAVNAPRRRGRPPGSKNNPQRQRTALKCFAILALYERRP